MTTLLSTKMSRWQLAALPFKAYVIAVPVVLFLYSVFRPSDAWLFHGHTALDREQAGLFTTVMYGYVVSIVALVSCGVFARDKRALRTALIFATLALISLVVLYPAVVVPATK